MADTCGTCRHTNLPDEFFGSGYCTHPLTRLPNDVELVVYYQTPACIYYSKRGALCGISGNEEIIACKSDCKNWNFICGGAI